MSPSLHETALRMLARRALSRRELVDRLKDKGFDAAAVAAEATRMQAAGLQNELELARAVCRARLRQHKGRRAIETELRRRGVDPQAGAQAMAELVGDEVSGALDAALVRAVMRFPDWQSVREQRQKVIRSLLGRGFGMEQVLSGLRAKAASSGDPGAPGDGGADLD